MRVKSYFVRAIDEAMLEARRELGAEAMLMDTRKLAPEHPGDPHFEVVFGLADGVDPGRDSALESIPAPSRYSLTQRVPMIDHRYSEEPPTHALRKEVEKLRIQFEQLEKMLPSTDTLRPRVERQSELEVIQERLISAEIAPALAQEIADEVTRDSTAGGRDLDVRLREAVRSRCRIDAHLGQAGRQVNVFVGPPGAGKTTSLVKLAVREGVAFRRSVHLIALDWFRAAGTVQLKSLASILGVGFTAIDQPSELDELLDHVAHKDVVLLDTPGIDAAGDSEMIELRNALARVGNKKVQLVLPASMNATGLNRAVDRFTILRPTHLLATRIDEADGLGSIMSASDRLEVPLSFFGTGQSIPEDIEDASAERIATGILGPVERAAWCAA